MPQVNINVSELVYDKLSLLAFKSKETKKQIVTRALCEYLDKVKVENV